MPTYLAISQTNSGLDVRPITAATRDAAAAQIRNELAQGVGINSGQRETIQVGLVDLAAFGTITPNAVPGSAQINYTNQKQPNIVDLPTFTVTTIAQANTAIQAIRTSYNTLLAELRAAGLIG